VRRIADRKMALRRFSERALLRHPLPLAIETRDSVRSERGSNPAEYISVSSIQTSANHNPCSSLRSAPDKVVAVHTQRFQRRTPPGIGRPNLSV
jgi:hypothetical protein